MSRLWSGETPPAEKPPQPARRHARLYEAEYAKQRRRIARMRDAIAGGEAPAATARAERTWDEPPAPAPRRAPTRDADLSGHRTVARATPTPPTTTADPPTPPTATGDAPAPWGVARWQPPDPNDADPMARRAPPASTRAAALSSTSAEAAMTSSRRRVAAIGGAAVLAVAAFLAVLGLVRPDRGARPELLRLPAPATDLVAGGGRLWVASPQAGAVWVLGDESAEPIEPAIRAPGTPARLAVRDGVAWAADTENGALVPLAPRGSPVRIGPDVAGVALASGAVWTASAADGGIRVLDRGRARTVATLGHPVALASDGRSVVVAGADGEVAWLDGRTRAAVATVRVGGVPIAAAFSHGAAWIADASSGTVRRVAPVASVIAGPPIDLGARPVAIAARGRDVYVACRDWLIRIDERGGAVEDRIPLAVEPSAIAVDDEYVWVAAAGRGVVARFDRRRLS
jgi:hypothetical protein